ncbi:MAG: hypothetical protein L6V35_00285 [Alistipes putredinis]|nr:MAG: hypothetical protein L6V35_00285 [Alistipes putredinis]
MVKEAQALRTSQNGDTIIYNADAFKVTKDAEVESLLAKMPGVKVEDGKVEAQGEEVKKILVDGREFFGDDVSTAIKTLPAEAVKSVEVFDKLSDNAEFTGMDDGEGYKAINIVTHDNMRKGTFGKVYGGVGYEPKKGESDKLYGIAGGNVSFFNNTAKWTVMALANNLNQQNFSFDDILGVAGSDRGAMVRPTAGIAHAAALKINLVDTWGKKKRTSSSKATIRSTPPTPPTTKSPTESTILPSRNRTRQRMRCSSRVHRATTSTPVSTRSTTANSST